MGGEEQMVFDDSSFGGMNFIINQRDFVGVFKIINFRDYNGFVLRLEVYKFLKSNQYILENIIQQNTINPTDSKLLDRVSAEKIHEDSINYQESKRFSDYLVTVIRWATENNQEYINLNILNKMSVILNIDQLKQLYHVTKSFNENYFLLESIFNMMAKLGNKSSEKIEYPEQKITDYIKQPEPEEPKQIQEYVKEQQQQKPQNDFELLLEYCFHDHLKKLVMHYAVNYYRYISKDSCKVDCKDNVITLTLPNILPYALSMDSQFFYDYILSGKSISLNNISVYATKLLRKTLFEGDNKFINNPIYFMCFSLILLVYCIRYLIEIYPVIFETQFESIVSNSNEYQKRIIQHYSNTYLKSLNLPKHKNDNDYTLEFNITSFNLQEQLEFKEDELIKTISSNHSHIIPVSQELFVKTVLGKLEEEDQLFQHPDFKFSNKKILDLDLLIRSQKANKKSNLIDPDNTVDSKDSDDILLTDYLNYNPNEQGLITKPFKYIMQYSKDPSSINFIKDLPKEIINLFPVIVKDVLTKDRLSEDIDQTYEYYRVIIDNLPSPESIRYTTILYIVFQIVVPYYYSFHKRTKFIDCLL